MFYKAENSILLDFILLMNLTLLHSMPSVIPSSRNLLKHFVLSWPQRMCSALLQIHYCNPLLWINCCFILYCSFSGLSEGEGYKFTWYICYLGSSVNRIKHSTGLELPVGDQYPLSTFSVTLV